MMKRLLLLVFACFFACSVQAQIPSYFTDISAESGFLNSGNNQGVSIADYDNDGDDDVYVSVRDGRNKLFRNNGDATFIEVSEEAGLDFDGSTLMSVWGDLDNDGFLDLFVGNYNEPNRLYRNLGDGTFENISLSAGIGNSNRVQAVTMGDIDQDGWLDVYVANLSEQNFMYKNNGDLTFTNVVTESRTRDILIAMGSVFFDYDNDKDLDLFLTHDANQPSILFENDGTGVFKDVSFASGANVAIQGMGVDVLDYNQDGFLDIYITNLGPNVLLRNNGDKTFTDVATDAKIDNSGMGWGITCLDYNNDGWQDIYTVNNYNFAPFPNRMYHNDGDGTFESVSHDTPLEVKKVSFGTASGDFNNDGSIDIALGNWGDVGLQLFRNEIKGDNWIKIKTEGTISNRSAIGSRLYVYHDGVMQMDEVMAGSSWASQNSLTLHFGLGEAVMVDSLMIRWPNGLEETYYDLGANETYSFTEAEGYVTTIEERLLPIEGLNIFPNPFKEVSKIEVELKEALQLSLEVYDLKGQLVEMVFEGELKVGKHVFEVAALKEKMSGVYVYRLKSEKGVMSRKVVKF